MLFNSIDFAFFLVIVFCLYWFVTNKNLKIQNTLLVLASYVFYGWWDWKFLSLIIFSSFVDYFVGIALSKKKDKCTRKLLLALSLFINLGFLGFFKYYNFFIESFAEAFTFFGSPISVTSLSIILPVGISFYTFQTLSYSIDVYRKKLEATKDPIAFFAFVSFFPQLVAGPIERATNLLPQFYKKRQFDYDLAIDGLRQMLCGLFKKIVIADNCARIVNEIFAHYPNYSGSTLVMGMFFFSFQIYGDFSGYSDIAIGTSRLFGFDLKQNFAFPYFSRDIAEFWRRWHISLSTWFRDYLYIPLGGSKGGNLTKIRNIFIIFLVSGFWHGANFTFIMWGFIHACLFLPLMLFKRNRKNVNSVSDEKVLPSLIEVFQMGITFIMVSFAWVFFRSETIGDAFQYILNIFNSSFFTMPYFVGMTRDMTSYLLIFILLLAVAEWLARGQKHALGNLDKRFKKPVRRLIYYGIIATIISFSGTNEQFIYFQF
ncbi:MAG: alginate O-acetyltransferase complex protein AlgI [Saprospiraceae bacterium]|jgi:alginate O-acetyltransferase complex protein AlgI